MPALCILCGKQPPIENSHVVPNFVIKRLKAGNPLKTLVHSDALTKAFQDGWKGDYLCQTCEGNFSKYENWFCKNIYDPWTAGKEVDVSYTEELGLFASSLAFRYIHYASEQNPSKPMPKALRDLNDDLRSALNANDLAGLRACSYLQFLAPVDTLEQFPPGINTYLFEAIDGKLFTYEVMGFTNTGLPVSDETFWITYVKLPGMFILTSLFDRRKATCCLAEPVGHRISRTGILRSSAHTGNTSQFVNDIFVERTKEIQADYGRMPLKRLRRSLERISKTPNPEDFRAYQNYKERYEITGNAPPEGFWLTRQLAPARRSNSRACFINRTFHLDGRLLKVFRCTLKISHHTTQLERLAQHVITRRLKLLQRVLHRFFSTLTFSLFCHVFYKR